MDCGWGIGTSIWTTMGGISGREPPDGLDNGIYDRVEQLACSLKILFKTLEQRDEGDVASEILPLASHSSVKISR